MESFDTEMLVGQRGNLREGLNFDCRAVHLVISDLERYSHAAFIFDVPASHLADVR
jgi:hypothetical protein